MKKVLLFISAAASALAGWCAMPDGVCALENLTHRWSFTTDATDAIGGTTASLKGTASVTGGQLVLKGGGYGKSWANLGTGLTPSDGTFTVEIWAKKTDLINNSRILDIDQSPTKNYLFMSWNRKVAANTDSVGWYYKPSTKEYKGNVDDSMQYALDTFYHIAISCQPGTTDGTSVIRWSRRNLTTGVLERSGTMTTTTAWSAAKLATASFWLGHSLWSSDLDSKSVYDEVRVWNVALTDDQLAWSARLGPDKLPTTAMDDPTATGTLTVATSGNGTVSVNGGAAATGASVVDMLNAFTTNTLTATANSGNRFMGWTGDTGVIVEGSAADATIKVLSARAVTLTATFEPAISTWSGSAGDGLWSTQGNWDALVPSEGSEIVFGSSASTATTNDVITTAGPITFTAEASAYTIAGQALTLSTLVNASTATQTFDVPVTAAEGLALSNAGTVTFGEPLTGTGIAASGAGKTVLAKGFVGDATTGFAFAGGTSEIGGDSTGAALYLSNANARATFTSGSTLTVANTIVLGQTGSGAQTLDLNGAAVTTKDLAIGRASGTTGTLNVTDAATLAATDTTDIGRSGTGTVNQSGGTATYGANLYLGYESTGIGTYNLTGGEVDAGATYLGWLGKGTLNVSGAGVFRTGLAQLSYSSGSGTGFINVTDGGVLEAAGVQSGNRLSRTELSVDGGTIRVADGEASSPNFFDGLSAIRVGESGMTFDTGTNAVAFNEAILTKPSTGTITKKGSGTLYLPANAAAVGGVKVEEGTVVAASAIPLTTTAGTKARTVPHLLHRWSFDAASLVDEVTGAEATSSGTISYTNGCLRLPGGANGTGYVNLGAGLLPTDGRAFTVEIFATPRASKNNARIFDFGDVTKPAGHNGWDTTFMTWSRGTSTSTDLLGVVYNGVTQVRFQDALGGYANNTPYHITFVCRPNACGDGKMTVTAARETLAGASKYTSLAVTASAVSVSDLNPARFWLGHSLYSSDNDAAADYDEVRIWDVALTPEQSRRNAVLGADTLPNFNGGLVHRWSFNGDYTDSVGGQTALACGSEAETKITWDDAANPKAVELNGSGRSTAYLSLGEGALPCSGDAVTIEFWATKLATPTGWEQWFVLGDAANKNHLFMTLQAGTGRAELKVNGTVEAYADTMTYAVSNRYHIAMTIVRNTEGKTVLKWSSRDDSGTVKCSGTKTTTNAVSLDALFFAKATFYLAHTASSSSTDKDGRASYDEVRIWRGALSAAQLVQNARLGPDTLPTTVDYAETAGDANAVADVDLSADGTFGWQSSVTVETVTGAGSLGSSNGTLTIAKTLDIAGEQTGTLALDGALALSGTWTVDAAGAACDRIVGTGTVDLTGATLAVRDPTLMTADAYEIVKGPAVAGETPTIDIPNYKLVRKANSLTLRRQGLMIIVR